VATAVVLDANALMMPFERNVRIEEELDRLLGSWQAVVPEAVLKELATMAAMAKGKRRLDAKAALTLAARFTMVDTTKRGDAGVLQAARALDAIVFSNDREVRAQARDAGLRTIYLRGGSHLELDGP
jgi:hypothetical protein